MDGSTRRRGVAEAEGPRGAEPGAVGERLQVPTTDRLADGSLVADYDYTLPEDRIAAYPAARRDESRLMVVPRDGGAIEHLTFGDIVRFFRAGDVLVVNESKVLPARLLGHKPTGAPSEILLIRPAREGVGRGSGAGVAGGAAGQASGGDPMALPAAADAKVWEALVRPGSKLKPGRRVVISDELAVDILDSTESGGRIVRLDTPLTTAEALERFGHMPLPPYLGREDEALDRERYQTVYARVPGSIAAPTAGLHFTEGVLARLDALGVERMAIELHVGVGTFRPVDVDDPAAHEMHEEFYHVSEAAARAIDAARARGGRVWAVGTTVVRTLETVARADGSIRPGSGATRLFIRPPDRLRVVDAMLTNFHLPRSTLLMLVAACAGYARTLEAYEEAIREGYRFYSYGDAMLVV